MPAVAARKPFRTTPGEKADRLEKLAYVEDALYRARSELQGPTLRPAIAVDRQLANVILEAKAKIDAALDLVEVMRPNV